MNDPLHELLAPKGPPASPAVREGIWARMLDALRQRRPPYEAVGLLLAGMVTGLLLLPAPPAARQAEGVSPPLKRPITSPPSAADIEWQALDLGGPSLYREAADRYLDEGDTAEAVRCYGHALDQAPAEELDLKQGDSSLLMAIKLARKEELRTCER
jgi:hypothetical protein